MHFDLENYVPVHERVQDFWREHQEDGKIETELIHLDDANVKNRMVVIRASVFVDGELVASGMAKEREGFKGANMTAFLENCETSAVGRALANYGVKVDRGMASREEMRSVNQITDEHKVTLDAIKSVDPSLMDKDLKALVKRRWDTCRKDPVVASETLGMIQLVLEANNESEESESEESEVKSPDSET
jgi:hypothetical protein